MRLVTNPPPTDDIIVNKGDVLMFDYDGRTRVIRVTKLYETGDIGGIDLSRHGEYRQFHPDKCVHPDRLTSYQEGPT